MINSWIYFRVHNFINNHLNPFKVLLKVLLKNN